MARWWPQEQKHGNATDELRAFVPKGEDQDSRDDAATMLLLIGKAEEAFAALLDAHKELKEKLGDLSKPGENA